MINPIESMVKNMLSQGNPQMIAQQIINNNPQFANAIQGKNLPEFAFQQMQGKGINPNIFMANMPKK